MCSWKLFPSSKWLKVQIEGFLADATTVTTPGRPTTQSPVKQTTLEGNDGATTADAVIEGGVAEALDELFEL